MLNQIFWGITSMLAGIFMLWFTITHPVKEEDINLS